MSLCEYFWHMSLRELLDLLKSHQHGEARNGVKKSIAKVFTRTGFSAV